MRILGALALFIALVPVGAQEPAKEAPEPDPTIHDEKMLRGLGLRVDGPGLLDYFRKRTFQEANPDQIRLLIADLGDDDFTVREKAFQELLVMGPSALVGIKQAENSGDAEVRRRATELKMKIEAKADPAIQGATARLIAKHKPPQAAAVLLGYMPFADPSVVDDLCLALSAVAAPGGKTDPALAAALTDKHTLKRAAAGEAIVRAKSADQIEAAQKLLEDAEPIVRLRVALVMAQQKDKKALPVLIELLALLPADQLYSAEEILVRLAGADTPAISLGINEASRKACRDAWHAWLTKPGMDLDKTLARLDDKEPFLGYTLVVQQRIIRVPGGPVGGEVLEFDLAKNVKWKINVDRYPVDAQVVGPGRVLIAEYQGAQVSERDTKTGEIKWSKAVGGNPIGVQRLSNGNTFVVMQNRLAEFDKQGNEVFTFNRPNHDIFRARKVAKGEIVFITNTGMLTRIEAKTQRIIKSFQVGNIPILFGNIDVLANGSVLVPDFQQNRVVEYDADGKQVRTFTVPTPNSAVRLPNGNTLVASQNTRRVVEFDTRGNEVWNHTTDGMVFNARKR